MSVIDFTQKQLERERHVTGLVRCTHCGHEWVALALYSNLNSLECPECKLERGEFIANVEPQEGNLVYQCDDCSCETHFIKLKTSDNRSYSAIICRGCGRELGEALL